MFEGSQRLKSMWQYLVQKLVKGPLSLKKAMSDTKSDFSELGPLITLLGSGKNDTYILKRELNDWAGKPEEVITHNEEQAKKDLKDLEYDVTKAQKANFYRNA